jgi:hypothetical protein
MIAALLESKWTCTVPGAIADRPSVISCVEIRRQRLEIDCLRRNRKTTAHPHVNGMEVDAHVELSKRV